MKKGFTSIELMICIAITGVLAAVAIELVANGGYKDKVKMKGYDAQEVHVFLKGTDYTYKDFYESKGLQKQFEAFKDGNIDPNFMNSARAKRRADEAQGSANAAMALSLMNTSSGR